MKLKTKKSKILLFTAIFMTFFMLISVVLAANNGYNYIDNYEYEDVLVFTYADNGANAITGNAALTKGDLITYYLEVVNQGTVDKTINLKFTIPKGYTFDPVTAGIACSNGINPCGNPAPSGSVTGPASINWPNIKIPAGTGTVSFKLKT